MRIDDPHAQQRIDRPGILAIRLNPRSRDEMVKLIRGLQGVYADEGTRQAILDLIARDVIQGVRRDTGRPGLDLWSIFVLLAARTALNVDYDRLEDLGEHHLLLRQALGLGGWDDERRLDWTRIWRNVRRVSAETVAEINRRVLHVGHRFAPEATEHVRADSFVMKTDIHHPSDLRQVGDGIRLVLRHATRLAELIGSSLLRQHAHLAQRGRLLTMNASRASASKHRDREERLASAVGALCDFADARSDQALALIDQSPERLPALEFIAETQAQFELDQLRHYLPMLATCVHVARERLVLGHAVALSDRLFSIFEPHTELIYRGKVPVPVEFGHRILVVEDSAGFIIHATVMADGCQDRELAVPVATELKLRYPKLIGISFDRGFHSPENQLQLAKIIPDPCLPTTGEKAAARQAATVGASWHWQRYWHPGIEAAIGNLEDNRGCRRCPDKGRRGFERYLACAVLSNNLITLGRLLWAQDNPTALPARTKRRAA